jgi:hypothetical protein
MDVQQKTFTHFSVLFPTGEAPRQGSMSKAREARFVFLNAAGS